MSDHRDNQNNQCESGEADVKDFKSELLVSLLSLAALLAVVAGGLAISWYRAGVQVGIYQRQGIVMSQWEVFCGARPAESVIQIKDRP